MNKKLVSNYLMIYAYHTGSIYEQLKIYRHIDNSKHKFCMNSWYTFWELNHRKHVRISKVGFKDLDSRLRQDTQLFLKPRNKNYCFFPLKKRLRAL